MDARSPPSDLQAALQPVPSPDQRPAVPWANTPLTHVNIAATTQRAIDIYLRSLQPTGEIGGIGFWQTANGYTAVALHDLRSRSSSANYAVLNAQIRRVESQHGHFLRYGFNDDVLWWALLCVCMYRLGGEAWYLSQAEAIWTHVLPSVVKRGQHRARGCDMEGGVFWSTRPGEDHLNSITTGLFAELSVRLALLTRDRERGEVEGKKHYFPFLHHNSPAPPAPQQYAEAARRSLGWILRCRYRPADGLVLDTIKLHSGEGVDWSFTYTTGVALGTCALLFELTREAEYLQLACHMAQQAVRRNDWVETDGVLTEHGAYGRGNHEAWKNDDAVGFKAVLVRHLGTLYEALTAGGADGVEARETAALISAFLTVNFSAQLERNTNGNGQYGPWWSGPFDTPTSHSQMAVLDVMAAVHLVARDQASASLQQPVPMEA